MDSYYTLVDKYFENGFQIIPIKPESKLPAISGHDRYSVELIEQDEIEQTKTNLKKQYNGHHIGCAMPLGPQNNLIAMDIDSTNKLFIDLVTTNLPKGRISKVGAKGLTAFYSYSEKQKYGRKSPYYIDTNGEIHRVEFLSTGAYTVIPPSIHPDTKKPYEWTSDMTLETLFKGDVDETLPPIDFDEAMTIIAWAANKLGLKIFNRKENANQTPGTPGRNDYLKNIAFTMLCRGEKREKILEEILTTDKAVHAKPLFEDRREITQRLATPQEKADKFLSGIEKSFTKFIAKVENPEAVKLQATYPTMKNGFHFREVGPRGAVKTRPDYVGLSKYVREKYHIKSNDASNWIYEDGKYVKLETLRIRNIISTLFGPHANPGTVDGAAKMTLIDSFFPMKELEEKKGLINMKSFCFDPKKREKIPHNPDFNFKYKLDFDYNPQATCLEWFKFLDKSLQQNKELIGAAQELFGYCIIGGEPFLQRAFCLIGFGRNGKGVFMDTLSSILGKENTTNVELQHIEKPFSAVRLQGKLANIIGEVPPSEKISSAAFKSIVAGENVSAAYKGKDEFDLKINARLVFGCNDFPRFNDNSTGLLDRLFFFPFDEYIKSEDRATNLREKLFQELPGIFNWALDGLDRIVKQQTIVEPEVSKKKKQEYILDADSVANFVHKNFEIEHNQTPTNVDMLYGLYEAFCSDNNLRPKRKPYFVRSVKAMILRRHGNAGIIQAANGETETHYLVHKNKLHIAKTMDFFTNKPNYKYTEN